jgi:hypothetical protein
MATISKFNRPEGDPVEAKIEPTVAEERKEIPKATFTINPPRFQPKPQITPEQEYEEVLKEIETAKGNNLPRIIIKRDLRDLAWQKLSQAGYKLQRRVLERTGQYDAANISEKDPNNVEFEINLTEFNEAYFKK